MQTKKSGEAFTGSAGFPVGTDAAPWVCCLDLRGVRSAHSIAGLTVRGAGAAAENTLCSPARRCGRGRHHHRVRQETGESLRQSGELPWEERRREGLEWAAGPGLIGP